MNHRRKFLEAFRSPSQFFSKWATQFELKMIPKTAIRKDCGW